MAASTSARRLASALRASPGWSVAESMPLPACAAAGSMARSGTAPECSTKSKMSSLIVAPILITTGEGDNRVVPGHSYKFAATLQANASGANPILLRIESKAGHGGGKPTSKIIDETADIYAFLEKVLPMN